MQIRAEGTEIIAITLFVVHYHAASKSGDQLSHPREMV
jgi:hypothetical protein